MLLNSSISDQAIAAGCFNNTGNMITAGNSMVFKQNFILCESVSSTIYSISHRTWICFCCALFCFVSAISTGLIHVYFTLIPRDYFNGMGHLVKEDVWMFSPVFLFHINTWICLWNTFWGKQARLQGKGGGAFFGEILPWTSHNLHWSVPFIIHTPFDTKDTFTSMFNFNPSMDK